MAQAATSSGQMPYSDTANFGDTGGNVTVSGGVLANSMFFAADGYVLSGGSITLGGGAVNVNGVNTATITSSVVGTTLQKNASGTLVLDAASGAGTTTVLRNTRRQRHQRPRAT